MAELEPKLAELHKKLEHHILEQKSNWKSFVYAQQMGFYQGFDEIKLPGCRPTEQRLERYDIKKKVLAQKQRRPSKKVKLKVKGESIDIRSYADIDDMEKLDAELNRTLFAEEIDPRDYELKEIHQFVMILPEKYWGPGSYDNWIRVGWALKNTDLKLFPTWLKFCSQSSEFSFD